MICTTIYVNRHIQWKEYRGDFGSPLSPLIAWVIPYLVSLPLWYGTSATLLHYYMAMALVHRHTGSLHMDNLLSTSYTLQTYWGKSFFHLRRIPILNWTMTVKKVKLSPTSAPRHHRTLAWRVFSGFYLLFIVFDDVSKILIV